MFEEGLSNDSLYAATDFSEELNDLADLDMEDDDDDQDAVDKQSQSTIPTQPRRVIAKKPFDCGMRVTASIPTA